jgi:hypothetical protein
LGWPPYRGPAFGSKNHRAPQAAAYRAGVLMFKFLVFLVAAVPVFMLVNRLFFRRSPKMQKAFAEFSRQVDYASWALLAIAACGVIFAVGKLIYGLWG